MAISVAKEAGIRLWPGHGQLLLSRNQLYSRYCGYHFQHRHRRYFHSSPPTSASQFLSQSSLQVSLSSQSLPSSSIHSAGRGVNFGYVANERLSLHSFCTTLVLGTEKKYNKIYKVNNSDNNTIRDDPTPDSVTASREHSHAHDHTSSGTQNHSHTHSQATMSSSSQSQQLADKSTEKSHTTSAHHTHSHEEEHHSLFGHSHSHGHHQPNELLPLSKESIVKNPAVRITWIGLIVNVSMALSKGIGGVYFHSQALIADAIHSVSDMLADFLTLATVNVAAKVGTPVKFPLGYGKLETVGSLMVSSVLLFAGISVGWNSLLQVFEFFLPTYLYEYASMIHIGHSHSHTSLNTSDGGHSHSHSHGSLAGEDYELDSSLAATRQAPNINAAWLAGASIIVKEVLFRKTMKIAVQTNSKVLVANAWHHRVDSLTAFVALLTVTGGVFFNIAWLDSIGGICVSALIIRAGWGTFKSAWFELIDRGEEPGTEDYNKIHDIITDELLDNSVLDTFTLSQLSVMTSGANTNIYVTLSTKENFDLKTLNQIEHQVKLAICKEDKFVRNIYVLFKSQQTEAETKKPMEHSDSRSDSHNHSH